MDLPGEFVLRPVEAGDLNAVNEVIEACVMSWDLPERVKRLSLSSYHYTPHDLHHLELVLAQTAKGEIAGVAALEPASSTDFPDAQCGKLLHGLYVAPQFQHQGIGSQLLSVALETARSEKLDGLLVKSQADAVGFFKSRGFTRLQVTDDSRDYVHRYWKPCDTAD